VTFRKSSRALLTGTSALALAFAGSVLGAGPAAAAAFVASTELELSDAIADANLTPALDTITLGDNITLTGNLPAITESLIIVGTGYTIDGDGNSAFGVNSGGPLIDTTFIDVTVTDAAFGISTQDSNVTITDSTFDDAPTALVGSGVSITISGTSFDNYPLGDGLSIEADSSSIVSVSGSSAESNGENGMGFQLVDSTLDLTSTSGIDNIGNGIIVIATGGSTVAVDAAEVHDNIGDGLNIDLDGNITATISNSNASENHDDGIDAKATSSDSTVILTNNDSSDNDTTGFDFYADNGTITGTGLTASGNNDSGLYGESEGSGSITVSDSSFTETLDGYGAELEPTGTSTVTLERVTVTNNSSGGVGVFDDDTQEDGSAIVSDSTIADNDGPGFDVYTTGTTSLDISDTTISGNSYSYGSGIYAALEDETSITLTNSTISGNSQSEDGAVFIYDDSDETATLNISHSTIVNNDSVGVDTAGGVMIANVIYSIQHSIIAGNTSNGAPSDLRFDSGDLPTGSISYSLVQNSTLDALTAVDAGTGNLKDTDPMLGPLANNGGTTLTHLPQDGSPVINAGNPAVTGAPTLDQRGNTRIIATIDLGAVETGVALANTGADATLPITGGALALGLGVLLLMTRRRLLAR